jgi:release factor glutamine methyltransferase
VGSALYEELLSKLAHNFRALPDKPEETAESTLRALFSAAAGQSRSVVLAGALPLAELDGAGEKKLRTLVDQRLAGTPLAHITGRQHFMDLELLAGPEALVPRKETEILGNAALELLRDLVRQRGAATVVDVCTGSGNLAVALASHEPAATIYAADISHDAVALARRNVAYLKLGNRVIVERGDLLAPFDMPILLGKVDLLTCNPPYISSAKVTSMDDEIILHEPREAFDGGPFGVRILQRLIREAARFLRPGGWLVFELGLGQGPPFIQRMQKEGRFRELRPVSDAEGQVRVIAARV